MHCVVWTRPHHFQVQTPVYSCMHVCEGKDGFCVVPCIYRVWSLCATSCCSLWSTTNLFIAPHLSTIYKYWYHLQYLSLVSLYRLLWKTTINNVTATYVLNIYSLDQLVDESLDHMHHRNTQGREDCLHCNCGYKQINIYKSKLWTKYAVNCKRLLLEIQRNDTEDINSHFKSMLYI